MIASVIVVNHCIYLWIYVINHSWYGLQTLESRIKVIVQLLSQVSQYNFTMMRLEQIKSTEQIKRTGQRLAYIGIHY